MESSERVGVWEVVPIAPVDKRILWNGTPKIGRGVKIGYFCEIYDKGGIVEIGDESDIGSWSALNCGDSHRKVLGLSDSVDVKPIKIGNNVFIGSHSFIGGGTIIGHHSVVAAGTIIRGNREYPPYSLIWGNPARVKKGYYRGKTGLAPSLPDTDGR